MARFLSGKIRVDGTLFVVEPLHVGSGHGDQITDMTVAVDGSDRCYAPGTGLAGAMRAWCMRRFDEHVVKEVFGHQQGDSGWASYLLVEDALICGADDQHLTQRDLEIRDHVGIDDQYGTANDGIKFDRAVLPPSCHLKLRMTLELDATCSERSQTAQAVVGHLLMAMQSDGLRIGAARTRGLGLVQLASGGLKIVNDQFTPEGIIDRLNGSLPTVSTQELSERNPSIKPSSVARLRFTINWKPELPTMVKSGTDGLLVDTQPLLGSENGQLAPLIPGSSIKGCLRQRAELIVRTILDVDSEWKGCKHHDRFHKQIDEKLPLIQELFGARARPETGNTNKDSLGIGALSVGDCFSQSANPVDHWDQLLFPSISDNDAKSAERRSATVAVGKSAVGRGQWQNSFHNAVDRWTGGVVAGPLFQVLEPHEEQWQPITLELDVDRVGKVFKGSGAIDADYADQTRQQALVLVLLTLRDLCRGRVPLGFAGNRGLGQVAVESIVISPIEGSPLGIEKPISIIDGKLSAFGESLSQWQSAWNQLDQEAANV